MSLRLPLVTVATAAFNPACSPPDAFERVTAQDDDALQFIVVSVGSPPPDWLTR